MIYTVTINPALDVTCIAPGFTQGAVVRAEETLCDPAGKGVNVSRAIRALGGDSVCMALVGGDTGKHLETLLKREGVTCDFSYTSVETRVNVKITDPVSHTHTDVNAPGAYVKEDSDWFWAHVCKRIQPGDTVAICGSLPTGYSAQSFAFSVMTLKMRGAVVCLDTSGEALALAVRQNPLIVKPNAAEVKALYPDLSPLEAAKQLCRDGVAIALVSLGAEGAYMAVGDCAVHAAAPKIDAMSTSGAGDAMLAGLLVGLEEKMDTGKLLTFAVGAGTAKAQKRGTRPPTREEALALAAQVVVREV